MQSSFNGFVALLFWMWVSPNAAADTLHYADQGAHWTANLRARFYRGDQGSQLIPLAWFKALRQVDGAPFLQDSLARYGYLPDDSGLKDALPIGFSTSPSKDGPMAGFSCAACHVRQITVGPKSYRIDGAPAFADFGALLTDLDDAVHRVLLTDGSFHDFALRVLGAGDAADAGKVRTLRSQVDLWFVRNHALISRSLPKDHPWGPSRLDAIGMIYDFLAGLGLGPQPTYLIPENIQPADAPARYPFLWNSPRQDYSQWAGFATNGNDSLALVRNLGELYGAFGTFHPHQATTPSPVNREYLGDNSANVAGLMALEAMVRQLGPPVYSWAVNAQLADQGRLIFNRLPDQGGCAACHGVKQGDPRPPALDTLKTQILNVGTDTRQWQIILRPAQMGIMEGASVPGSPPLQHVDLCLSMLKTAILGSLVELRSTSGASPKERDKAARPSESAGARPKPDLPPMAMRNVYEARVLQGIWAAAPYLHNGSVPSLTELLKPSAQRVKSFKVGPLYDPAEIGLAKDQPAGSFTIETTGCADLNSGNSNCGHDYGTHLDAKEKEALLEYLKTF